MLQGCNNIDNLYHDCWTCWNNLATSLIMTTWDKQCEHNLLTACSQTCLQDVRFLRVYITEWNNNGVNNFLIIWTKHKSNAVLSHTFCWCEPSTSLLNIEELHLLKNFLQVYLISKRNLQYHARVVHEFVLFSCCDHVWWI